MTHERAEEEEEKLQSLYLSSIKIKSVVVFLLHECMLSDE